MNCIFITSTIIMEWMIISHGRRKTNFVDATAKAMPTIRATSHHTTPSYNEPTIRLMDKEAAFSSYLSNVVKQIME